MIRRCFCILLLLALCAAAGSAEIRVYFLDVGEADAALVQCDGASMLIDAGNYDDSGFIFSFLYNTMKLRSLDCVIATHPHEDHIGGVAAALSACKVGKLYCSAADDDTEWFADMKEAAKQRKRTITVPSAGDSFQLGGATVQFISPNEVYEDVNDNSLCVRIDYKDNSFLFAADAEYPAETGMLASGFDLHAQVLKVAHHGSDSSSSMSFLRAVMPETAVISSAAESEHGNPDPDVLANLRKVGSSILRTDEHGTIVCTGDGESISFETHADIRRPATARYIGNLYSKKYHRKNCESVADMQEHNRIYFVSRIDAILAGYKPCGRCKP